MCLNTAGIAAVTVVVAAAVGIDNTVHSVDVVNADYCNVEDAPTLTHTIYEVHTDTALVVAYEVSLAAEYVKTVDFAG